MDVAGGILLGLFKRPSPPAGKSVATGPELARVAA